MIWDKIKEKMNETFKSNVDNEKQDETTDVKAILKETKYGESGIGGVITKGTMYVGYPR